MTDDSSIIDWATDKHPTIPRCNGMCVISDPAVIRYLLENKQEIVKYLRLISHLAKFITGPSPVDL